MYLNLLLHILHHTGLRKILVIEPSFFTPQESLHCMMVMLINIEIRMESEMKLVSKSIIVHSLQEDIMNVTR